MPRSPVRTVVSAMSNQLNPHWRHFQKKDSGYMGGGGVQGLKSLGLSSRNTRFKSQLHPRTGKAQRTPLFGQACSLVGLRRSVPSFHRLLSPTLTSPGI